MIFVPDFVAGGGPPLVFILILSSLSSISKLLPGVDSSSGCLLLNVFVLDAPSDSVPLVRWKMRLNPDGVLDFSSSFLASTASIIAIVFAAADIVAGAGALPTGDLLVCGLSSPESELLRRWRTVGRGGLWLLDFFLASCDADPSTLTITHPLIAVSRRAVFGFGVELPELEGGSFVGPRTEFRGPMRVTRIPVRPPGNVPDLARRLWEVSEQLTGRSFGL